MPHLYYFIILCSSVVLSCMQFTSFPCLAIPFYISLRIKYLGESEKNKCKERDHVLFMLIRLKTFSPPYFHPPLSPHNHRHHRSITQGTESENGVITLKSCRSDSNQYTNLLQVVSFIFYSLFTLLYGWNIMILWVTVAIFFLKF